ncbi:MAG: hypothetical protein D6808_03115 [Candidatus Dadabacteria bacterium]|nr:MAG: hypothetical protein D6808_03115 [Candidatus Dadabacteria bacterium]
MVLTYALTIFGTFLTRSGVVQSVHAFAETDIGEVFLQYLAFILLAACALTWIRRKELKSERQIKSFFSREAAFLLNNLVLLSICFATLWGVLFPIISEAVTGAKQTVGIPFFNKVNTPLFIALLFLMGAGPMVAWRKATLSSFYKSFLFPALASIAVTAALIASGITSPYPLFSYAMCVFVAATVGVEWKRGLRTVPEKNILSRSAKLFTRHRVRYAGYLVHIGVAIAAIGITASMSHKVEKDISLKPEGSASIGRFNLKLGKANFYSNSNFEAVSIKTDIYSKHSGKFLGTLYPEKRFYIRNKESTTEVALRTSLLEDLYIALAGFDSETNTAFLKVFVNPLQIWLWIGVFIMVVGTVLALLPAKTPRRSNG